MKRAQSSELRKLFLVEHSAKPPGGHLGTRRVVVILHGMIALQIFPAEFSRFEWHLLLYTASRDS